eukprot:4641981-Amphidinium_carterae.1
MKDVERVDWYAPQLLSTDQAAVRQASPDISCDAPCEGGVIASVTRPKLCDGRHRSTLCQVMILSRPGPRGSTCDMAYMTHLKRQIRCQTGKTIQTMLDNVVARAMKNVGASTTSGRCCLHDVIALVSKPVLDDAFF